ncbi:uncharacterized protein [Musca autumnalis]|uniref:uncharacterized protein n=1 Tax=Musca autumnalis TaxID=221902 RepID=UPI003CF17C2B
MEVQPHEIALYHYNQILFEEKDILRQLEEEAEHYNNEHSEDELAAAIAMMLMYYQVMPEPQVTPRNKFIAQSRASSSLHHYHEKRKNHKSGARQSVSLLACCRNILKEFLSIGGTT